MMQNFRSNFGLNRIYNKILDRDWFPVAYLSRNRRVITPVSN